MSDETTPQHDPTVDEFDAVLKAVSAVGAANAALDGDVSIEDGDDEAAAQRAAGAGDEPIDEGNEDEDGEDEDGEMTLKGALPDHFVDAGPLIETLIAANNRMAKGQMALLREVRALRRDQGTLAKANALLLSQNRDLRGEIEAIGAGGAGRRSAVTRPAAPMAKGRTPAATSGLAGEDLLVKATTASLKQPELLTAGEIARINEYVNMGASQDAIRGVDPALGARLDAALAAAS